MDSDTSKSEAAQRIWAMLDDMAENDPVAYKKFLDKQMSDGKKYMAQPEPHMCVKTTIMNNKNGDNKFLFLNIFEWNRIPEPKSDEDPIPVMGGPVYTEQNGTVTDTLVSVAFHPSVLKQYGINSCLSEERNMLINLAINYVCDNHKIMLSRNFIVMDENRKHWGSLQMAQKQLGSKEDDSFGKELNELEQSFGPMASGCSDSLMDQLSNISLGTSDKINTHGHNSSTTSNGTPHLNLSQTNPKKGLIEDLNPCSSLPEPLCELVSKQSSADQRLLVLKVHLEGVQSVQQCQLDISQRDVCLLVPGLYELHKKLDEDILEDESVAKFSKKSHTLTLTLPVTS